MGPFQRVEFCYLKNPEFKHGDLAFEPVKVFVNLEQIGENFVALWALMRSGFGGCVIRRYDDPIDIRADVGCF